MSSFVISSAEEKLNLVTGDIQVNVVWVAEDPDDAPVIQDVLGKRMVVSRVSLFVSDGEQRLYLGGHPVSKVSHRNVSIDMIPVVIELEDHWATRAELDLELPAVESPTYGALSGQ